MKAAIEPGEDINNVVGEDAANFAVFGGDVEAARLLLAGADPSLYSNLDGPPLWHADDEFGLVDIAGRRK